MAINLHAPFELMRLVAPDMMAAGEGRIIVVSSTSGQSGDPIDERLLRVQALG